MRWLISKRLAEGIGAHEDADDIACWLVGDDDTIARRHSDRRLHLVRSAGGEVASA